MKMKATMSVFTFALAALSAQLSSLTLVAGEVEVQETPEGWQVETALYRVQLSRTAGGLITRFEEKRNGARFEGTFGQLTLLRKHERKSKESYSFPAPTFIRQGDSQAHLEVMERDARRLVCRVTWSTPDVNVEETLTFASDSRVVWKDYRLRLMVPMEEALVEVNTNSLGLNSVFLPERKRVSGREGMEFYRDAPGYVFAYEYDQKSGVGLAAPIQEHVASLCYYMNGVPEGSVGNRTYIACHSRRLAWEKVPLDVSFRVGLVVGGTDRLEDEVLACAPISNKPAVIQEIWPVKLIHRTHEKAHGWAVVRNRSGSPQKVQLVVDLIGGIGDEVRTIFSRWLSLAPYESRKVMFDWKTGAREYGFELRGRLLKAGKEVDRCSEYTSVADTFTKVGQMTVLNPGWASKEGQEKWLIPHFRRNYTGIMEYY